ncbi:MAG: large-conductance mechanosensitive channel protein MscL [Clostridia bacterium]|nr:large-conductance mechanosensitive channel protein MscL [Clostridia bacterium]
MWEDFKAFVMRGNVLDLAVGVIIGTAFGKIVSSLVEDIIMPIIGLIIGGIDLTRLELMVGYVGIKYGVFAQSVLDFLIITTSLFIFIKFISNIRKKEPDAAAEEEPAAPTQEELLTEIRDLLKERTTNL